MLTFFRASQVVLKYTGMTDGGHSTPPTGQEQIDLLRKLYKHTLKRTELRDELFAQLAKQTRNNPDRWVSVEIKRVSDCLTEDQSSYVIWSYDSDCLGCHALVATLLTKTLYIVTGQAC